MVGILSRTKTLPCLMLAMELIENRASSSQAEAGPYFWKMQNYSLIKNMRHSFLRDLSQL